MLNNLLFIFDDLPHCCHPRRPVRPGSGCREENHAFVFVGMFTPDGLYGQANLGVKGNLHPRRRMTNPYQDFNATKQRRAA